MFLSLIYFDNKSVKDVYAHRKPIADFDIGISGTTLSLTSTSYDLDKSTNKGYGAAVHIEALKKYGPTPIHRRSFIGHFV